MSQRQQPQLGSFTLFSSILKNQHEVSELRRHVSTFDSAGGDEGKRWLSPVEKGKSLVLFNSLLPEASSFASLRQLQAAVLNANGLPLCIKPSEFVQRNCLVDFGHISIPSSTPVCPKEKDVKSRFLNQTLEIGVHSLSGYSFSSEFSNVYKGRLIIANSYSTFITIAKRALFAADTTLEEHIAEKFAVYIGRISTWMDEVANTSCEELLTSRMPNLDVSIMEKPPFTTVKVFIGKSENGSLCFWIRVCPILESLAIDEIPLVGDRNLEASALKGSRMCYCRRFILAIPLVDELDVEGFADPTSGISVAPPPPPKTHSTSEVSILLMCKQNVDLTFRMVNLDIYDEHDDESVHDSSPYLSENAAVVVGGGGGDGGADTDADADDDNSFGVIDSGGRRGGGGSAKNTPTHAATPRSRTTKTIDPSPCAELMGWGQDACCSLGLGIENKIHEPRLLPVPTSLALERVRMISCSPRHTLLLTLMGNIYCCGENTEGALGLGDIRSR